MKNIERWKTALEGKTWVEKGNKYSFHVDGAYDKEGKRPKIYVIVQDHEGVMEPYATLTHNEPQIPLNDDQVIARVDGHHIEGARVAVESKIFEEVDLDNTLLGLAVVLRLAGGLP